MDSLEEDDEKTNIYIIGDDGKVTHSEEDQGKGFVEKLSSIDQPLSSDSEDPTTKVETNDDIAPQKRILFGPPSWNPEQLANAIKAVVQDGVSLTVAARENGIPRTTLANKIYGRKRKRTTDSSSSSSVTSSGYHPKILSSSYTNLISSEQEKLLAEVLARQRHVESYSITRAVFDLVKYFARDRNIVLSDDEEVKDWLKFFFLRYPSSRFTVWHTEHGKFENDDRVYEDFVMDTSKSEQAEDVKRKLFQFIQQRTCFPVHLLWWYSFLVKYKTVKRYFVDHLKWPNSLLDDCHVETNGDELITALTNILLSVNRCHGNYSVNQNQSYSSSINQNPVVTSVANQSQLVKVITGEPTDSPSQVIPRRKFDVSYRPILPKPRDQPRDQVLCDDTYESCDVSITSTSKSSSFSVMLAQEGLMAVEKKLSSDELRYFTYRLENPQLEEAFYIWKNLKMAVVKKESDTDASSI